MSEIFYSEVDRNLQFELNRRAQTASTPRLTEDIDYMVGKIANVTIIPYADLNKTIPIASAVLGGVTTRSNSFLPGNATTYGFLDNHLYRTPPYVTSAEISIGDHSMGLLNTATVNFTIPDPYDIEYIEGVYFRPGRAVEVIIEHPSTAAMATTNLSPTTLANYERIASLYPGLNQSDYDEKYRRTNRVTFEGLITSFTFEYQPDFSITATLSMRGTSNVYTDVSLMVDQNKSQPDKQEKPNSGATKQTAEVDTFFQTLQQQFEKGVKKLDPKKPKTYCTAVALKDKVDLKQCCDGKQAQIQSKYLWGVIGTPSKSLSTEQRYITLAFLIQFINEYCLDKLADDRGNDPLPTAYIVFNEDVCKSTYYDSKYFKSSNPERIFFPDRANRTYEHSDREKNLEWFAPIKGTNDVAPIKDWPPFKTPDGHYTPATIMINLNVIEEIVESLKEQKTFSVNDFLKRVSDEVYRASGNAIELTLTTHPEDSRFLLWYDCKFIKKPGPQPYVIPMTSDDPYGQAVRDFKFSAKLPDSAAHLAYALNQDLSSVSESDIAPYLSYLYAQNPDDPAINNSIGVVVTNYAASHAEAVTRLTDTIKMYAAEATKVNSDALYDALQKYIQFPTPSIEESNKKAAPVIPFDTEFTVDGINGFKYGDIITFRILPARYINNTVFGVINVTHTIGSDGVWTTTVRSIMRPKFD